MLRVALCLVTIAVFIWGIEYFALSHSECVLRCFELPFLLLQTSCSGDEPFMKVLMLRWFVGREIVWTVEFLRRPHPNRPDRSAARALLITSDTLENSRCHRKVSVERCPQW